MCLLGVIAAWWMRSALGADGKIVDTQGVGGYTAERERGREGFQFCMADSCGSSFSSGCRHLFTLLPLLLPYPLLCPSHVAVLLSQPCRAPLDISRVTLHWGPCSQWKNGVISGLSLLSPSAAPLQKFLIKPDLLAPILNTVQMKLEAVIVLGNALIWYGHWSKVWQWFNIDLVWTAFQNNFRILSFHLHSQPFTWISITANLGCKCLQSPISHKSCAKVHNLSIA